MTPLTIATAEPYGVGVADINPQAADGEYSNSIENDGRVIAVVHNGGIAPITVTVPIEAGPFTADEEQANETEIGVGETALLGPWPTAIFGTEVVLEFSDASSVTVAPVRLVSTPL